MGWPVCNTTLEREQIEEDALWRGYTFHRFGLILSAVFALIAVVMSGYLIFQHCTHYLKPWEQRHIIRVLFMVPIYATVSFLSYFFYRHSVYYAVIRDCYEAFAIASFFALLCHYIAPDLHSQKDYFRGLKPRAWVIPLNWFKKCCGGERGIWRTPRSGLTWFNIIWLGVFQYCLIRVTMTLVALITQLAGRYCLESLNPAFAHIWVMVIEGACVTLAMYCLIQFYIQLRQDLTEHRPFLKILAIKLVIFLSFWQTLVISFLTSSGTIKANSKLATPDIKIGIPSMLLCIEMALFSILHLFAFPWKEYDIHRSHIVAAESGPGFLPDKSNYKGGPLGIKALMDAFNPWDLVKAVVRGFRWLLVGRHKREQDISYRTGVTGTDLDPTYTGGTDPAYRNSGRGKPGKYQPLGDEDDEQLNTLAPGQYGPARPGAGGIGAGDTGDIGRARRYNEGPDHLRTMHPTPGTLRRGQQEQETGVMPAPLQEDTGYHGAQPAGRGNALGGNGSHWDRWGGAHGTGEFDHQNRF
ncbi:MAG: hypothetical protein M1830_008335 [Pleopsidium flavum]|nr:MAG: hypothetical protein M1830_008335 [Pleopsidium flavum]